MKVIFKLLIANVKMTVRNKQALFWSMLFPLLFIAVFGLFNMEKGGFAKVEVLDEAKTQLSETLTQAIKNIPAFNVEIKTSTPDEIYQDVKSGQVEYGIIIPKEIENLTNPQSKIDQPISLTLYYDAKNVQNNSVVLGTLQQFVTQANLNLSQAPTLLMLNAAPVEAKKIKYIEFIATGMLGMSVMQYGIIGISIALSRQREDNILKKLLTTPLLLRDYIVAFILNYLILSVVQITILLAASHFLFNAQIYGNLFLVYGVAIFGTLIFLCLGFVVAGIAKTSQAAAGLAQLIATPMMFLSGVFFSTSLLPNVAQKIVQFLPLTPLLEALRKVSLDGQGIAAIKTQLVYLFIWLVVAFLLALATFRFTENKE